MGGYIPRKLIVDKEVVTEEQLLQRGKVFVILAEPGAGKTTLLTRLAELLHATRIKATVFQNLKVRPPVGPLLIDAMDEVARVDEKDTRPIIASASEYSAHTVIFAARSSEWDNGCNEFIRECFGVMPTVVFLEPFNLEEQRRLFDREYSAESFEAFFAAARDFELAPLLGNPQFLLLFAAAYVENNRTFTSKAKIFEDAVGRLAYEANRELGQQRAKPPAAEIIALGNEVFAKLMLSGSVGIATVERLSDRNFPYANGLCRDARNLRFLLDTRLFKPSDDAETHEPVHRIVAEYCAARYLVSRVEAADRLSAERLLAVIAPNGATRTELRGMLGWMAAVGAEALQLDVIDIDPYAVLANGDPSQLSPSAKRKLLSSLSELSAKNPMFRQADFLRRFNVGRFFTEDLIEDVRSIVLQDGGIQDLILELLVGAKIVPSLAPDLSALITNPSVDGYTRNLALNVFLSMPGQISKADIIELMKQGDPEGLELATRAITTLGASKIGIHNVHELLTKLCDIYPDRNKDVRPKISKYAIMLLISSFNSDETAVLLDKMTDGMVCSCAPRHNYLCQCRTAKSKIVGRLLDRYFQCHSGKHDVERIFGWMISLHFDHRISEDRCEAVSYLRKHHELRRSVQWMAFSGIADEGTASETLRRLNSVHSHSGLLPQDGDRLALSQLATDGGMLEVWSALLIRHNIFTGARAPDPLRAAQRIQARTSPELLALWCGKERQRFAFQEWERTGNRRSRSGIHIRKQSAIKDRNLAHLRANLEDIEAGRNWWWLKRFADGYLLDGYEDSEELVDDPETPLRALRNCLPLIDPFLPTVEGLGRGERPDIRAVALAACLIRFREGKSLGEINPLALTAARVETELYSVFGDGERDSFEASLDAVIFKEEGAAEFFLRAYMEPRLASIDQVSTPVSWLERGSAFRHLLPVLPLEWLDRFPNMRIGVASILVRMADKHANRSDFLALIDRRLSDPFIEDEVSEAGKHAMACRRFWQLNSFFYHPQVHRDVEEMLKSDASSIFAIEDRIGRFGTQSYDGDRPKMSAQKVYLVLDAYVEAWPKVPLPSTFGTGDPKEETAYRFLLECFEMIADDTPDRRIPILDRIIAETRFNGFRDRALSMRAEAGRLIALQDFTAPSPYEIQELLDHGQVASVEDLRALVVEELGILQRRLIGAETNPLEAFYSGGKRVDENIARNRIVEKLKDRMASRGLSVTIEGYMAGGNRSDITASVAINGSHRLLVVEVKGQWNRELYVAASAQLDQRYAIHPDAARQGIYLALWYGNGEKVAGVADPTVTSAVDLKARIVSNMSEDLRSRVSVVVLDLSRSPTLATPVSRNRRAPRTAA